MTDAEPIRFRSKRDNLRLTVRPDRVAQGTYERGEAIEFRNGRFRTTDRDTIAFQRGHKLFGLTERGFWEEPASEAEPASEPSTKRTRRAKSKS